MDPGVRIFAPGSSDSLASAILHLSAIPCGEVCLIFPALHVRTRFPVQAATACQPLPHVNGSPVSEYCGLIRHPKVFGSPTWCFGRPTCHCWRMNYPSKQLQQEPFGSPKFLTLLSTHATLFVDPGRPSENSPMRSLCVGFCSVDAIAICIRTVCTITPNNGAASSFRKCGLPCGLCRSSR